MVLVSYVTMLVLASLYLRKYVVRFGILPSGRLSDKVLVINPNYGENISGFGSRPLKPTKARYEDMERESQFFTKLEESVLSEGFRNPVLCYSIKEGVYPVYGANRIWLAKKHDLEVPCIISDYTDRFSHLEELLTEEDILSKYTDNPSIDMNNNWLHIKGCRHSHL